MYFVTLHHCDEVTLNERICLCEWLTLPCVSCCAGRAPRPIGRGLGERVYFWGCSGAWGPPSESPYKEVLSGWVESGLSASLSLLDGANSFASSQHLPSLARIRPVASLTSPSTTFPLALLAPVNTNSTEYGSLTSFFLLPCHR